MGLFTKKKSVLDGPDDFDRVVRAFLTEFSPPGAVVEEVPEEDAVRVGGSVTNLTNLRRRWTELQAEDRLPWLAGSVREFLDQASRPAPTDGPFDPGRLRAIIRSRAMMEASSIRFTSDGAGFRDASSIPVQPLAGDLCWVLAEDSEHTLSVVNDGRLDAAGLTFADALAFAFHNLSAAPIEAWSAMDGRIFSPIGDDYVVSRAFLPGAMDALPLEGDLVAFVTNRRSCVLAAAADADGIRMAAEYCQTLLNSADQVSFEPIVGRPGQWDALVLPADHPAYPAVASLTTIDRLGSHQVQHEALSRQFGDSLFVAQYKALQTPSGRAVSYCTWSVGVPTLLPETDLTAFYVHDEVNQPTSFMVPSAVMVRIVGHLLEPTDHHPVRWRALSSPSEAEIDALRAEQIDPTRYD